MTAELDRFAGDYRRILDRSLGRAGGDSAYFADVKASYLARKLGPGFAGTILDFGCGIGLLTASLRRRIPAARIDGYDPSTASLAQIPAEVAEGGTFSADLSALGRAYDLVVVANVLHHIPKEARRATAAVIAERTAPGGRVAVIEHNPWNPATRVIVAGCPLDEDAILLPPREATNLLAGAGLAVERRDYVTFFPEALRALRPLEPALEALPLGAQYAVLARR